MNQSKLQTKLYKGYGKAAVRIGELSQVVTPSDILAPLAGEIQELFAAFTPVINFSKFNTYGHPVWIALLDGTTVSVGDYVITGRSGTFFIAAMQQTLPIMAVSCNRIISVARTTQERAVGAVGYAGTTQANSPPIMSGWPASVLQGTKGEKNPANLPGDERIPWWSILFPQFDNLIVKTSDIIEDDIGRRYIVSSSELTDLGWRITASLQGA